MVANDDLKVKISIEAEADDRQIEQESKGIFDNIKNFFATRKAKINLEHNLDELNRELKKTRTEYEELKSVAKSTSQYARLEKLEEDLKDINFEINQTKGALKDLGADNWPLGSIKSIFTGGAIVAWVTAFGQKILELGNNAQQAQISFTTMLGSAEDAQALLGQLSDFAKTTPFELQGIRESATQLLAMGVQADEMIPTLKALGDVSAGLNVPLERLALNYGQVLTQGKLTGKELKDFTTAGVPLLDELSKNLGKSKTEIQNMVSQGKISSQDMVDAFNSMTGAGGRFANLMEQQSKTLAGQRSNLQDTLAGIGEQIGLAIIPLISDMVSDAAEAGDSLNNMGGEGMTAAEMIARGIAIVINGIRAVILGIQSVGKFLGSFLGSAWSLITSFGNDLKTNVSKLVTNAGDAFDAFGNNIKVGIAKWVNGAINKLNGLLGRIRDKLNIDLGQIDLVDEGEYKQFFDFSDTKAQRQNLKSEMKDVTSEIGEDRVNFGSKIAGEFDNMKDVFSKSSKEIRANSKAINKELNNLGGDWGWGGGSKKDPVQQKKEELKKLRDLKIKDVEQQKLTEKQKNQKLLEIYNWYKDELVKIEGKTNDELLKSAEEYMKDYYKEKEEASVKEQKLTLESIDKVKKYDETIKKLGDSRDQYKDKALKSLREVNNSLSELDEEFNSNLIDRYNEVKEELANNKNKDTMERYMNRYSRDEVANLGDERFGSVGKKEVLEYYDLLKEMEQLNGMLTEEQKEQAKALDAQTETEKLLLEYEKKRAVLVEQKNIYEAITAQGELADIGKKAIEIEGDIVKYWDNTKQQYVEITDFKNQEIARELLAQQDKITAEYELTAQAKEDELKLVKEHSGNVIKQWKDDTTAYKKELDNRVDAVREYVKEVQALLSSIPSSYRAYGWELGAGVTMVGENWPEAIVRRQASYVQPRNAVQNYSTVNNTSSNLNINGLELWYNSVDEMLADFKSRLTYRN